MKIIKEESLRNFEFWGGAKYTVKYLTDDDFDTIEEYIEDSLGDEVFTETQINDMFWFDDDYISNILGYDTFDDLIEARVEDEDDE